MHVRHARRIKEEGPAGSSGMATRKEDGSPTLERHGEKNQQGSAYI